MKIVGLLRIIFIFNIVLLSFNVVIANNQLRYKFVDKHNVSPLSSLQLKKIITIISQQLQDKKLLQ